MLKTGCVRDETNRVHEDLCGPLNVDSEFVTGELRGVAERTARVAAHLGLAREGNSWVLASGERVHIKVATRTHEQANDAVRGLAASSLLARGKLDDGSWWILLRHIEGVESPRPSVERAAAFAANLARWHRLPASGGLRLDDPAGLAVWLGTTRRYVPQMWPALASAFAHACEGVPMVEVHGDAAITHNTLWTGLEFVFIDPGAVAVAPAALDLAFAVTRDIASAGFDSTAALLEEYGAIPPSWQELLALMAVRTSVDCYVRGDTAGQARLNHLVPGPWRASLAGLRAAPAQVELPD